jgi:hypothetical protein
MAPPPATPPRKPEQPGGGKPAGSAGAKGSAAGPLSGDERRANAILGKAVARLTDVVEQETAALRSRAPADLNESNNRKSQGLLELDQALRLLDGGQPSEEVKAAVGVLRQKLDANHGVLKTHLAAVREVAAIIAEAIRSVESDGTYSLSFRSKGPAP